MNFEFFKMIIQLIFALAATLGLMFLSVKLMGTKLNGINNRYIKVIERVQVTKENAILIVKIGEKGYIMTSTAGHMEKLSELSEEEINIIEEDKRKSSQEMASYYVGLVSKLKKVFLGIVNNKKSKEEKNEKK